MLSRAISHFILQQAWQVLKNIPLLVQAHETETHWDKEAHPRAPSSWLLSTNTHNSLLLLPLPHPIRILSITKEHLTEDKRGRSICRPFSTTRATILAPSHSHALTVGAHKAGGPYQRYNITCPALVRERPRFLTLGLWSPQHRINSALPYLVGLPTLSTHKWQGFSTALWREKKNTQLLILAVIHNKYWTRTHPRPSHGFDSLPTQLPPFRSQMVQSSSNWTPPPYQGDARSSKISEWFMLCFA